MKEFRPEPAQRRRGPDSPAATTKALDWIRAREAGARLPEHVLPEDTDVLIWTQAMEQQP